MAKTYTFSKRDKNRYRKVYSFIRRKPDFQFVSDGDFKMIVGTLSFSNSSSETFNFPATVSYTNIPVITAVSYDSLSNSSADVNVFITALSTTSVTLETSAPFSGELHFHVISQD
jgi:hypothetical protein